MRFILGWFFEQRSIVSGGTAIILFAVTLILRYYYDIWWPFGIVAATGLGVLAMVTGSSE